MKASAIRYSSFVLGNFNKYLDNMQKNAVWGTELELTAASEVLSFNFIVYMHGSMNIYCEQHYSDEFNTIRLE